MTFELGPEKAVRVFQSSKREECCRQGNAFLKGRRGRADLRRPAGRKSNQFKSMRVGRELEVLQI